MPGDINIRCKICEHVDATNGFRCFAFGENGESGQIPIEIWEGGNDHSEPFPGDHGKQFKVKAALANHPYFQPYIRKKNP